VLAALAPIVRCRGIGQADPLTLCRSLMNPVKKFADKMRHRTIEDAIFDPRWGFVRLSFSFASPLACMLQTTISCAEATDESSTRSPVSSNQS
jgi:hypothetical protein